MRILGTLSILVLIVSCKTNPDNSLNSETAKDSVDRSFTEVNDEFDLYLDNFERTDLPIIVKGCEQDVKGLKEFDGIRSAKYNDN